MEGLFPAWTVIEFSYKYWSQPPSALMALGEQQKSFSHQCLLPGSSICKEIRKHNTEKNFSDFSGFILFFFFLSHPFCLLLHLLQRLQHGRGRTVQAEELSRGSGGQMPLWGTELLSCLHHNVPNEILCRFLQPQFSLIFFCGYFLFMDMLQAHV